MGERKVINKYYPHDFDPRSVPRRRRPINAQMAVRMMLPMSVRCATCGEYLGRGTKFNARKEDAAGEKYVGAIQVYRFYIKCSRCSAEIAFKTDPKNSDYAVESGATRNFEAWRADDEERARQSREEEDEADDPMSALENRSREAKREMDVAAALEEMRSLRSRRTGVTPEQLLESLKRGRSGGRANAPQELDEEDEELVKSVIFRNSANYVKRIDDIEDDEKDEDVIYEARHGRAAADHQAHKKQRQAADPHRPVVVVRKRLASVEPEGDAQSDRAGTTPKAEASSAGAAKASSDALQKLCCCYPGSDDDDESC
ncbi:hypothetical protein ACP4OV_012630 [Aristida adscensionis]